MAGNIPEDSIMEKAILNQMTPMDFVGSNSAEIKYERDFEELCIKLESYTNRNPRMISTKEFYALLNYAKKESKQNKNNRNSSPNRT